MGDVDVIALLGLESRLIEYQEKQSRKAEQDDPFRNNDEPSGFGFVHNRPAFNIDAWYRKCFNEQCAYIKEYETSAYWEIHHYIEHNIVHITVTTRDGEGNPYEYDYEYYYDIERAEYYSLFCPFCGHLGMIVLDGDMPHSDDLPEYWYAEGNNDEHNRYTHFIEMLERSNKDNLILRNKEYDASLHRDLKKSGPPPTYQWKIHGGVVDVIKLKNSGYTPPDDCPFKQCSYYKPKMCNALKCVIAQTVVRRVMVSPDYLIDLLTTDADSV